MMMMPVTTLRSGICYRKSVCLSVCLPSVTFVRHTQGVETFGNISSPFCRPTLDLRAKLYGDRPRETQRRRGGLNARGVAKQRKPSRSGITCAD